MDEPISMYENLLWTILDEGSKIFILTLLIKNDFVGECKLTAKIKGDITVIVIEDEEEKSIEIPIDILSVLNN